MWRCATNARDWRVVVRRGVVRHGVVRCRFAVCEIGPNGLAACRFALYRGPQKLLDFK